MSALMFVRDGRTLPFVPVTIAAMEAIRAATPKRRPYAVTTYMALLEFANENRADRIALSQREIVERVGASRSTVQAALSDLQTAGVLRVIERVHGNARVENEYVVIEPEDGVQDSAPPPVRKATPAREASGGRPSGKQRSLEEHLEDEPTAHIARAPEVKFRGRKVPNGVAAESQKALERWNERTGQTLKPFTGRGQTSDALKRIVGAMLDYPEVVTEWPAMIDRALSQPWWTDDAPGTGVVFGPHVVERMIQQAQRPAIAASAAANVHPMRPRRGGGDGWTAADMLKLGGVT